MGKALTMLAALASGRGANHPAAARRCSLQSQTLRYARLNMGATIIRCAACAMLFVTALTAPAFAQDTAADGDECKPACRLGFECVNGECVAEQCKPACRAGFTCIDGECKSACNPPCASNERCTETAQCVRLTRSRPIEHSDEEQSEKPPVKQAPKSDEYKPSATRIYIGPMLFALGNPYGPGLLTDFGATLAFDFSPDESRVFFIGFRTGFVGDSSGVLGAFDLDLGIRPRLVAVGENAFSLVIGGGLGGGFISANGGVGFFHLPARFGVSFDFGGFTLQALVGPALLVGRSALGAVESSVEVGGRF